MMEEAPQALSDNAKGLALAVASSAFIGVSFILKKIGLLRAAKCGARAGTAPSPSPTRAALLLRLRLASVRLFRACPRLGSHHRAVGRLLNDPIWLWEVVHSDF